MPAVVQLGHLGPATEAVSQDGGVAGRRPRPGQQDVLGGHLADVELDALEPEVARQTASPALQAAQYPRLSPAGQP